MSEEIQKPLPEPMLEPAEEYVDDTPVEEKQVLEEPAPRPMEDTVEDPKEEINKEDILIKPQNVKEDFPMFLKIDKFDPEDTTISIPASYPEYVLARIGQAPNTSLDDSEASSKWVRVIRSGMSMVPQENMYLSALEDEEASWGQAVDFNGKKLNASAPQFRPVSGQQLNGERGVLRFMRFAGLGSIFMLPLWHTGIWITLKAPSEARLLELYREMINDKIELGRSSYGLALSATVSVFTESILKVAMEQLYETNLKTDKHLFDVISSHDIPTIIWGLASTIWNNGFQYERACSHDPEKCNHLVQEKIDLTKLLWVNKKALTSWQVAHMSRKKSGEVTMEDVERYKKESLKLQNRRIEMSADGGNSYHIDLKVPTIREYFEHTNDWINGIVNTVENAVSGEANAAERNAFITQHAKSTLMRQYAHWVDSISFDDNSIEDKETIEAILDRLSSENEIRDQFTEKVKEYINDSDFTVIGVPTYECPACGGKQEYTKKNDSLYSIIPMDMLQTFFFLHVQKIQQISRR